MRRQPNILLIASGGGHTAYAEAVAEELSGKATVRVIAPFRDTWTRKKMAKFGEIYETEKAPPGSPIWKRILSTIMGFIQGLRIPRADVVVATGSNHSIGPALAQKIRGSKLVVIEAIDRTETKSMAVNILSRFADIVALHWDVQKKNYPNGKVYGPILPKYNGQKKEDWILITCGTEGYAALFDYVADMGRELFKGEKIVLQTGRVNPEKYKNVFWKVFDFDPEFSKWLAGAKIVITHQGATAAEAAITFGKKTIICYNSALRSTSKKKDTETFARLVGAAFCEKPEDLPATIRDITNEHKDMNIGTKYLVEDILNLAGK